MAKSPLFQSRHYRFLAQLLHDLSLNDSEHWYIVENFSAELKRDNPNFKTERFEHAVSNGVNTVPRKPSTRRATGKTSALPASTYGHFITPGQKGGSSND